MTYGIKEIFNTLQGEGVRVGARSVFVRVTGCNLWDGHPLHRDRGAGPCARWCFAPDTPVLMADWSWRAIGDLHVGDVVLAVNAPGDLRLRVATVQQCLRRVAPLARIRTSIGELIGTADHKFWHRKEKSAGAWEPANRLVGARTVALAPPRPTSWKEVEWRRGWLAGVAFGDGCFWTLRKSAQVRATPYDRDAEWVSKTSEYRRFRLAVMDEGILAAFEAWAEDAGFALYRLAHVASGFGKELVLEALWITQSEVAAAFETWLDVPGGQDYAAGFVAGTCDAEGNVRTRAVRLSQYAAANPVNYARIESALTCAGILFSKDENGFTVHGASRWRLLSWCTPVLARKAQACNADGLRESVGVIEAVDSLGVDGEVVTLTTDAGCYIAGGLLVKNCDTDFFKGEALDLGAILARMDAAWPRAEALPGGARWAVLTGGEPLLQADVALLEGLHAAGWKVAVETNGTVPHPRMDLFDHVCVSPKRGTACVVRRADELKVVLPGAAFGETGWSDAELDALAAGGEWAALFVQAQDIPLAGHPVGVTVLKANAPEDEEVGLALEEAFTAHVARAVGFVMQRPAWRLSTQMHKLVGLP